MSIPESRKAATGVLRRSFMARAAAAIVAGFTAGNLFKLPAVMSGTPADAEAPVSVRPHPHAVPRNNARPSSHE